MPLRDQPSALEQIAAGILAGTINALLMSPLDVIKSRMQVQSAMTLPSAQRYTGVWDSLQSIVRSEGILGYWRGYSASAVAVPVFWSSYFFLYEESKALLTPSDGRELSGFPRIASHSASALMAAICCDTLTNPLWVVRTRLQTMHLHRIAGEATASLPYRGVFDALITIARTEGVSALYKGLVVSWLGATHVAVQFPLYEHLRREVVRWRWGREVNSGGSANRGTTTILISDESDVDILSRSLPEQHRAVAGAAPQPSAAGLIFASTISKLVASLATYPHETIRARLQDQRGTLGGQAYSGIIDCFCRIVKSEGYQGLYAGFSVNLVRALPACALTFFVYEWAMQQMRMRRGTCSSESTPSSIAPH